MDLDAQIDETPDIDVMDMARYVSSYMIEQIMKDRHRPSSTMKAPRNTSHYIPIHPEDEPDEYNADNEPDAYYQDTGCPEPSNDKLCSACSSILHRSREPDLQKREELQHHLDRNDFELAVENGCSICSYLGYVLAKDKPSSGANDVPSEVGDGPSRSTFSTCQYQASSTEWLSLAFNVSHKARLCSFTVEKISPESKVFAKHDIFTHINRWMQTCQTKHGKCRAYRAIDLGYGPSRILDVSEGTQIRLLATDHYFKEPYLTLSHRWESCPSLMLTKETEAELASGISVARLSKTFQDAIRITQSVGISYLWIDSLCIIQNSEPESDWMSESQRMNSIYGGAVFNIAAVTAWGEAGGSCIRQDPISEVVKASWPGHEGIYRLRPSSDARFEIDYRPGTKNPELLTRGWVCQELDLAPAVLYCTPQQIWWACQCSTFSEQDPRGRTWGNRSFTKRNESVKGLVTTQWSTIRSEAGSEEPQPLASGAALLNYWKRFVNRYSSTALTRNEDKLVAIQGLSRMAQTGFDYALKTVGYHSGVWDFKVLEQLDWSCSTEGKRNEKRSYVIPSWSWASVDSRISFSPSTDGTQYYFAEVISFNASPLDGSGMAKNVDQSCIALEGFTLGIRVPVSERSSKKSIEESKAWLYYEGSHRRGIFVSFDCTEDKVRSIENKEPYLYLPLVCNYQKGRGCHCSGILLKASGDDKKRYQRCGSAWEFRGRELPELPSKQDVIGVLGLPDSSKTRKIWIM